MSRKAFTVKQSVEMFEVKATEHCGLGVFATQLIPAGTLVIREKPFLGNHFNIIIFL